MIERWQIPELNEAQRFTDQAAWLAGYQTGWRERGERETRKVTIDRNADALARLLFVCGLIAAGVVLALILK